jgi:hypothetical protein
MEELRFEFDEEIIGVFMRVGCEEDGLTENSFVVT